jgi:hypothetical protein
MCAVGLDWLISAFSYLKKMQITTLAGNSVQNAK